MPTSPTVSELSREVFEEQRSLLLRWGDVADHYLGDVSRFIEGDIDAVTFGREVADLVAGEALHVVEVSARLGSGYVRLAAALADRGGRSDTAAGTDEPILDDAPAGGQ
jgi:hypothetical protein